MNMRRLLALVAILCALASTAAAQQVLRLPEYIHAEGGSHHVQGIAFDLEKGCMYYSFTTSFVKTDLQGNVLGTVEHIQGHLGAMVFNPSDRKVYASLECKDDVIGRGLSDFAAGRSMFYIAIIDVDRLDSVGVDSEDNEMFKVVCIREAGKDYHAKVGNRDHRYGCSGIDGVTIAPKFGSRSGKDYLYVAYGIYGDVDRDDNDCQVLLRYDFKDLEKHASTVRFGDFYDGGPRKPAGKYFICTGNTTWGVQNLAYDAATGNMLMAVYRGAKDAYPNYDLFAVPIESRPPGHYDDSAVIAKGFRFPYGSTGITPVSGGWFYISRNGRDKESGKQFCNATLYRWTGDEDNPFVQR